MTFTSRLLYLVTWHAFETWLACISGSTVFKISDVTWFSFWPRVIFSYSGINSQSILQFIQLKNLTACVGFTFCQQHCLSLCFSGNVAMPSILKLQQLLERAWEQGFDKDGSNHFDGHIVNTKRWTGATDFAALLSSRGIKFVFILWLLHLSSLISLLPVVVD